MFSNEKIISMAMDLCGLYNFANNTSGGYDKGQMIYSISIGMNSRGTTVDLHVQRERFSDIVKSYPVCAEYNRVFIRKTKNNQYHLSYVLPSYQDQVSITVIFDNLDQILDVMGQDVMEHVRINT